MTVSTEMRKFETLFSFEMIDNMFVYNCCDLFDYLDLWNVEYFESGKIIKEFCERNNLDYYARPRESFWISDAVEIAKSNNRYGVIVEDMS